MPKKTLHILTEPRVHLGLVGLESHSPQYEADDELLNSVVVSGPTRHYMTVLVGGHPMRLRIPYELHDNLMRLTEEAAREELIKKIKAMKPKKKGRKK
jgi:hypothetical protein